MLEAGGTGTVPATLLQADSVLPPACGTDDACWWKVSAKGGRHRDSACDFASGRLRSAANLERWANCPWNELVISHV